MSNRLFQGQPTTERLVIGITGLIGAGKTSTAQFLQKEFGFRYLRYSEVLSQWKIQMPVNRSDLQRVGWEVMGGGLQHQLNARLIARVADDFDHAIDGLRHPIDFESMREKFGQRF